MEKAALVFRRVIGYDSTIYNILSPHLNGGRVLSVGCGEGRMERILQDKTGIEIEGVEVTRYKKAHIPVKLYDGKRLPVKDKAFDNTIFVYMLHHSNNIEGLLSEAVRVTKQNIFILDHVYDDAVSKSLLKAYDYAVNFYYKMPIPFNFLKSGEWSQLFRKLNLRVEEASVISPLNVFFKLGIGKD